MAEKKSKESESKDVEMAAEGEEKEGAKEGTEEEVETKKQGQKDKDLLTFEGKLAVSESGHGYCRLRVSNIYCQVHSNS